MGRCARRAWLCELASHFRVQYAWVLAVSAVWWAMHGHLPGALLAASFALANLSYILPLYLPRPLKLNHGSRRTFRLLLANVCFSNRSHDMVLQFIRQTNPDLVLLEEIDEVWLAALERLADPYPYSKAVQHRGGFGIALLSRLPHERLDVERFGNVLIPSLVGQFLLDGQRVTIIGTHPWSPISPAYTQLRNQHLEGLAAFASRQPVPLIVLGDLNTTSWSPVFRDVLRIAKLRDSRVGFGVQPTWPVGVPFVRIPIDHCLVSDQVVVHRRWIGPSVGSDHAPLMVECSINAR